jgi:hypothetical protein
LIKRKADNMSIVNITEIRRLAQSFRNGIESAVECGATSSRTTRSTMPYFPKGCCEVASVLLAQYLYEKGIHTKCIHGEYDYDDWENKFPHTWLETNDGVIIDITADQFSGEKIFEAFSLMPCYVGTDRRFYSLFDEDYREEEFQELWNCDEDFYKRNVIPLYDIILNHIV